MPVRALPTITALTTGMVASSMRLEVHPQVALVGLAVVEAGVAVAALVEAAVLAVRAALVVVVAEVDPPRVGTV